MEAMQNYDWHLEKIVLSMRPRSETFVAKEMSSTAQLRFCPHIHANPGITATADTIVYVSTFISDDIWDLFYFSFGHFSQETSYE